MSDPAYDLEYFRHINEEEGPQAERLADILCWHYQPRSVIDVGCASGLYLKPFMDRGVRVLGQDSAPDAISDEVIQIPRYCIELKDITEGEASPPLPFDLALCIEVAEHLEEKFASALISHLSLCSDVVFFSAAHPGQGGVGHINCQPKEYWETLFAEEGFRRDIQDENYLRTLVCSGYHLGWLPMNMMVLKL